MFKKTKKEIYNESSYDKRTYINGEIAIKPYYYYRNGKEHVRYIVDRCIELSPTEAEMLKMEMTENPSYKQSVLAKAWNFFTETVGRPIIMDGIAELEKKIKGFKDEQQG